MQHLKHGMCLVPYCTAGSSAQKAATQQSPQQLAQAGPPNKLQAPAGSSSSSSSSSSLGKLRWGSGGRG